MKKDFIAILIVFLISIVLSLPLLKSGLFQIHDDQQVARLYLFDQSLKSGQFPVRWVNDLGFGFGYPLFIFYPPFVYMLGEIFHLAGFGFVDSIKLVFFVSIIFSGIAMYIFSKEFWGRTAAIVSAAFYMMVPYRALDIYVRGALAESFSFVWPPLILWSFYKLLNLHERSESKLTKTPKRIYLILSAVFLALLMITHNLIFLPFMLILPFYLCFLLLSDRKLLAPRSFSVVGSVVFAFGLSAFFWLPSLVEKKFTLVDQLLLTNLADYKIHFVYPQQLWNWTWGFGGSAAGLADGISFKIGKLHILTSIAASVIALIHIFKNRAKHQLLALRSFSEGGSIVAFVLLTFSAFMTTYFSKFIWDLIPQLAYLQFPWRFLIFTALFSSILAGTFIYYLKLPILRLKIALILIILLVFFNLKLFNPQSYRPDLTDEITTSKEQINWEVSQTSFEYSPKGFPLTRNDVGVNIADLQRKDIPKDLVNLDENITSVQNRQVSPHKISFTLDTNKDAKIIVNRFNFPGWQAKVDDSPSRITDNNKFKLIQLEIPQGNHQIALEFKNTLVRTVANMISIVSIIILILLWLKRWPNPIKT